MGTDENRADKLDRELGELLQGLRVLLPGVQVLFAFLLTVPFTQRFDSLDDSKHALFVATLVCAALATLLLATPGVFHRVLFREREKDWILVHSNRFVIAGTGLLALAMTTALYLVVDVVLGMGPAIGVASGIGILFAVLWFVVPLVRRAKRLG